MPHDSWEPVCPEQAADPSPRKAYEMKPEESPRLVAEPLYKRAENAMVRRIVERVWSPGMRLPNEFDLAAEFGISQGTVRKALVALEKRGLLVRSPGRGTTVARATPEESLFTFFRLRDEAGYLAVPEPLSEKVGRRKATRSEQERFGETSLQVCTIERVRQHAGSPFAIEKMQLPASLVAGIEKETPLPNSLYPYLQERFGLSIMTTDESISAVRANKSDARLLGIEAGDPLLRVERQARDLANRVVELRVSLYLTTRNRYCVQLTRAEPLPAVTAG